MISTRQLIFIISIVFCFVNCTSSGRSDNISYSNDEIEEVDIEHVNYCKLELTTPFQNANPFENLLHAFLYRSTADFLEAEIYTYAAYVYYCDLLNTTLDLRHQPALEYPRQYCNYRHRKHADNCLRAIEELGCQPDDAGVDCLEKLYYEWKKDESLVYSSPYNGTERISDDELATALSRGTQRFPGLSYQDLSSRLSDESVLDDFYGENENRRENINYLQGLSNTRLQRLNDDIEEDRRSPCLRARINIANSHKAYEGYNAMYTKQQTKDLKEARNDCFGRNDVSYSTLVNEFNRRQKVLKQSYAMYIYNQIQLFGRNMGLDSEERKIFKDPEDFCTTFLRNNPHYYDDL